MWPVARRPPDGTFYFNNYPNLLDQFLVNKNMAKRRQPDPRRRRHAWRSSGSPAWSAPATTPGPIPFGGMGKPVDKDGFSDHFPIGVPSPKRTESGSRGSGRCGRGRAAIAG